VTIGAPFLPVSPNGPNVIGREWEYPVEFTGATGEIDGDTHPSRACPAQCERIVIHSPRI